MNIKIDRQKKSTIIEQISEQISENIQNGFLADGVQLPSIREFSKKYHVSHVTVSKAYQKLEQNEFIQLIHGKGAFVKNKLHTTTEHDGVKFSMESNWMLQLKTYIASTPYTHIANKNVRFNLSEAIINPKLLPSDYLINQINQTLSTSPKKISSYSLVDGEIEIKESIREYITVNGKFMPQLSNMIITSGVQQGIDIVAKTFIGPNDTVIVEETTYFHALEVFSNRGAKIISVSTDNFGMKTDELSALCSKYNPKLIYTIPTFHNPTGVSLSLERRKQLLKIASEHHFLIIEDDSWSDIYFDDMVPPPAIKSLDKEGIVIYLKGFSKYLSPGCRIGAVISNETIFPHLFAAKSLSDLGSPVLTQTAVNAFLNSNRMVNHLAKLRTALEVRRNRFFYLLQKYLPNDVQWTEPAGGLCIWISLPKGSDTVELLKETSKKGISFLPGIYSENKIKSRHLRISYSYIDTNDIDCAVIGLCRSIQDYLRRSN